MKQTKAKSHKIHKMILTIEIIIFKIYIIIIKF